MNSSNKNRVFQKILAPTTKGKDCQQPKNKNMKLKHYECDSCQSVFDIRPDPSADNPLEISFCPYCGESIDKDETYELDNENI